MGKTEIWKEIEGWEGLYSVSNCGRVKSLTHTTVDKIGRPHTYKGRILSQGKDKDGYCFITLFRNGRTVGYRVHRLVALAFIPNPDNYDQINHIDEDKNNNCVQNLEWCNNSYNIRYGSGIRRRSLRRRNSPQQSKPVQCFSQSGELISIYPSVAEAARVFCCNPNRILRAVTGITRDALGCIWVYSGMSFEEWKESPMSMKVNSKNRAIVATFQNNTKKTYKNIACAIRDIGFGRENIIRCCRGAKSDINGIKFSYL